MWALIIIHMLSNSGGLEPPVSMSGVSMYEFTSLANCEKAKNAIFSIDEETVSFGKERYKSFHTVSGIVGMKCVKK